MAFEKFDKSAAIAVTKPARVSVSTSGIFSLTWKAYEMLGTPKYVEFFFDAERRVIAIAPAEEPSNAYQVRLPRTDESGPGVRGAVSLRGETFLKYYGIDFSRVWRRTPWIEGKFLCFSLDKSAADEDVVADLTPDVI